VEYVLTDLGKGLYPHLRADERVALLHEDKTVRYYPPRRAEAGSATVSVSLASAYTFLK